MQLKDKYNKVVENGDTVILLEKEYGYRKLKDAYLLKAIYLGQGQYGHQFRPLGTKYIISKRQPECAKI